MRVCVYSVDVCMINVTLMIKTFHYLKDLNHAKEGVMADFLQFVNANSKPNGRQSGSYSAQFFFHPKVTRVALPKQGEKNYEEKARSSLVHEFNRVQRELGKGT